MARRKLQSSLFFLGAGLAAGCLVLILAALYAPHFKIDSLTGIAFSTVIEELVKLLFLFYLIRPVSAEEKTSLSVIYLAIFFGIGFSLLESIFILFFSSPVGVDNNLLINQILPVLIHVATSVIIGLALSIKKKESKTLSGWLIIFFFLALAIHLGYNLLVLFKS